MTDTTTLQADYDILAERCRQKAIDLQETQTALRDLASDLVDADSKKRSALLARRAELVNLRDALDDELALLSHRRDVAHLAIFEYAEQQAQEKLIDLAKKRRTARRVLNTLLDDQRRFQSVGRGKMTQAEADKTDVEFSTMIAKAKAESFLLLRDVNRASAVHDRARNALEALRKELGVVE